MSVKPGATLQEAVSQEAPETYDENVERSLASRDTEAVDDPSTPGEAVIVVRLSDADPDRYVVLEDFAQGGLGRILKVKDRRLGRTVAVKQMLRDGGGSRARFMREATLTARLAHPAIVPVHDVGRWPSGEPFYSMKLVSGRSLRDVVASAKTLDERLALLPSVIAVADAVAYAHSEGIIHRDIKPDNVLVGEFGETVVIDWGLAKDLRSAEPDDELTGAGAIMGTPYYMPPEQARGSPVDERADVYAIGAVLYEVLAGAPPFASLAARAAHAALLDGAPPAVESIQPGIPADLAAIVRKAMARAASERYPSARELAEDLRRFQTGRLVTAHRYDRWTLVVRWLRRYRAPVSVAAAALAILAIAAVVSVRRVVAERNVARRRADQLLLQQARGALERDATEALAWLATYPDDGEGWSEVRTLAMEAASRGVARHVPAQRGFLAFTSDGRGLIGAQDAKTLTLRDAESGAVTRRLQYEGRVDRILASADGHTLAIVNVGGNAVTLYDTGNGATRVLPAHHASIAAAAISPDGRWIASGSADGSVQLWPTSGGEGRMLRGHEGAVFLMAFSRDGRWLFSQASERAAARLFRVDGDEARAVASGLDQVAGSVSPDGSLAAFAQRDGSVSVWSTASGERVREFGAHGAKANDIAFSPDGRWIAFAGDDGLVSLWPVAGGERRALSGHAAAALRIAFSQDGRLLASGSADGEVRVWEVEGDGERVLGRSPGGVEDVAFSPDGRRVASKLAYVGEEREVRIWDVPMDRARVLRGHGGALFHAIFSPRGGTLATTSEDKTVRLWDLATGAGKKLEGHSGLIFRAAFSPDGSRLASSSFDGTTRLWDLGACSAPSCSEARILAGHEGTVMMPVFSPDGRLLATAGADATVRIWDATSGEARVLRGHTRAVGYVTFSPDGKQLASAGTDPDLHIWDVATGAGRALTGHAGRIYKVAYTSDGRALFTASADQTIRRWDAATGNAETLVQRGGELPGFALSPDDRVIAASGDDGRVIAIDLATGARRVLGRHQGAVYRLAFSPDGALLATAGRDRTVRLWNVQRGALAAIHRHDAVVEFVAFSPDGLWLAAAGGSASARLLPAAPRAEVPAGRAELRRWMASLSTAALDDDARLVSP